MHKDPDLEILTASIDNTTTGRWLITTESGTHYLLNMDRRWVIRERSPESVPMRRDNSLVGLVKLVTCQVGEEMHLIVDVRRDGTLTTRDSTPVVHIKQLGEGFLPW